MKSDTLERYLQLRRDLWKEKEEIESRLLEINEALKAEPGPAPAPQPKAASSQKPISLKAAILKVTSERPMTKKEIYSEVQKLGYRFNSKNPLNSIGVVLYGKKPKFKRAGGRFSPILKGQPTAPQPRASRPARSRRVAASARRAASPRRTAKAVSGKRVVSPATRAKLAALAKARWNKVKASGRNAL